MNLKRERCLAQSRILVRAFLREASYKRLKLDQLLGQLGVFLTLQVAKRRGGSVALAHLSLLLWATPGGHPRLRPPEGAGARGRGRASPGRHCHFD
jgi:hypothetical protein